MIRFVQLLQAGARHGQGYRDRIHGGRHRQIVRKLHGRFRRGESEQGSGLISIAANLHRIRIYLQLSRRLLRRLQSGARHAQRAQYHRYAVLPVRPSAGGGIIIIRLAQISTSRHHRVPQIYSGFWCGGQFITEDIVRLQIPGSVYDVKFLLISVILPYSASIRQASVAAQLPVIPTIGRACGAGVPGARFLLADQIGVPVSDRIPDPGNIVRTRSNVIGAPHIYILSASVQAGVIDHLHLNGRRPVGGIIFQIRDVERSHDVALRSGVIAQTFCPLQLPLICSAFSHVQPCGNLQRHDTVL